MNVFEEWQQAWQSQCHQPLDFSPDQVLKSARLGRQIYLKTNVVVILVFLMCGTGMLLWSMRDVRKQWPWLIYSALLALVIGFILFNQLRRRLRAPHYDKPLLAHVEWAIKDLEYRMWQDRYTFWWYTLPCALACIIPATISTALGLYWRPDWNSLGSVVLALLSWLFALGVALGIFVPFFVFIHRAIVRGLHKGSEARDRELAALRSLRETLLSTESNSEQPYL